jgi:diguanylate cyclase (GGDEF)-like protein
MKNTNSPIDAEMRRQENSDIAKRTFTGTGIYLVLWIAVSLPNQFHHTNPQIWWTLSIIFLMLAVFRTVLTKNFDSIYSKSPRLWKVLFFPQILLSSITWGVLCAFTLTDPALKDISFVILICTAGLTSGGCSSTAPNHWLTKGLITAFLLPIVCVLIFAGLTYNISLLFVICIFWLGISSIAKAQHHEYSLSLQNSFAVKKYTVELERLNSIDGLTGLKNRAFFDDSLTKERKKSSRTQVPLTLFLIDIDHFKSVNDRYGHLIGDECLRQVSAHLQQNVHRETDVVARFGGEEFVVLLHGTTAEKAVHIAENIRRAIDQSEFITPAGNLQITVSIGISNISINIDTTNYDLISSADKALYIAKNSGRNRVHIDTSGPTSP